MYKDMLGKTEVLKHLKRWILDRGVANVNGKTVLHIAVQNGSSDDSALEVVQCLVEEYKQDVYAKDQDGKIPSYYANCSGSRALQNTWQYLKACEAKLDDCEEDVGIEDEIPLQGIAESDHTEESLEESLSVDEGCVDHTDVPMVVRKSKVVTVSAILIAVALVCYIAFTYNVPSTLIEKLKNISNAASNGLNY